MARKQQTRITALYCRLSRDDEFNGDSASIQTQKTMLSQYAKENCLQNCEYYIDDGFSGTDFERPDFKRLISDIEANKISTIVVKDLSRLGREYLQTGYYTEIYFPKNDVRFIAINDNFDSEKGENEFAPFKNIINEWYAKDCSKKVKSALITKTRNGEYVGSRPAYGYKKSPEDKKKLIPDENAPIVKMMFQMALEGKTCFEILTHLKELKIPTPRAYTDRQSDKFANIASKHRPYDWSKSTVYQILTNPIYKGDIVWSRYKVKSFKNKKLVTNPESEWIIVENTHEPLVSREDFETVQERVKVKKPAPKLNPNNIFRGLLFCGRCGTRMVFGSDKRKKSIGNYSCNLYKRYGGEECSYHYITLEVLKNLVFNNIKQNAILAKNDFDSYVNKLTEVIGKSDSSQNSDFIKEYDKCQNRIKDLDKIIQKLYEDSVFGVISAERFKAMSASMEKEQKQLKERCLELNSYVQKNKDIKEKSIQFAQLIRNYANIDDLTPEILNTLIEKIIIDEEASQNYQQKTKEITIIYRFVGKIITLEHIQALNPIPMKSGH